MNPEFVDIIFQVKGTWKHSGRVIFEKIDGCLPLESSLT